MIRATATPADGEHMNVLRLELQPSTMQRVVRFLFILLPHPARVWLEAAFPEWHLPSRLVLEK